MGGVNKDVNIDQTKLQKFNALGRLGDASTLKTNAVTAKTNDPIDMISEEGEKTPVMELVESSEFLNLSKEEQLAKLKELYPNHKLPQLQELLLIIKSHYSADNGADIEKNSDVSSLNSTLEAMRAKNLTPEQHEFLAFFDGKPKSKEDIGAALVKYANYLDNLIPQDFKESKIWQNLSPREKLDKRIDVMLSSVIDGFSASSEGAKAKMRNDFIEKIAISIEGNTWESKEPAQKEFAKEMVALSVDACEKSGKSLQELMLEVQEAGNMSPIKNEVNLYTLKSFDNYLSSNKIDVQSEEWQILSPEDRLHNLFKGLIAEIDPNMDEETQKGVVLEFQNYVGEKIYGKKEWNADKDILTSHFLTNIEAISYNLKKTKNDKLNTENFLADIVVRNSVIEKYEVSLGIKKTPFDRGVMELQSILGKSEITHEEAYKELAKLRAAGKELSADLEIVYNDLETLAQKNNKQFKSGFFEAASKSPLYVAQKDYSYDKVIKNPELKKDYELAAKNLGINLENASDKDKKLVSLRLVLEKWADKKGMSVDDEKFQAWVQQKNLSSGGDRYKIYATFDAFGLSGDENREKRIEILNMTNVDDIFLSVNKTSVEENAQDPNYLADCANVESEMVRGISRVKIADLQKASETTPEYVESAKKAHVSSLKGPYAKENAEKLPVVYVEAGLKAETISNLNIVTFNDKAISNEITDTYFSKTMEIAPDDTTRNYYVEQAANNVETSDSLEIVAASTRFIQDENIKSQSEKVVMDVAETKFPDSAPAIQKAIETGTVSEETLAKEPEKVSEEKVQNDEITDKSDETSETSTTSTTVKENKTESQASAREHSNKPATNQAQTTTPAPKAPAQNNSAQTVQHNQQSQPQQPKTDSAEKYSTAPKPVKPASFTGNSSTGVDNKKYDGVTPKTGSTYSSSTPTVPKTPTDSATPATPATLSAPAAPASQKVTSAASDVTSANNNVSSSNPESVQGAGEVSNSVKIEGVQPTGSQPPVQEVPATAQTSENAVVTSVEEQKVIKIIQDDFSALAATQSKEELMNKLEEIMNHIEETNLPITADDKLNAQEQELKELISEGVAEDVAESLVKNKGISDLSDTDRVVVRAKLKAIFQKLSLSQIFDALDGFVNFLGADAKDKFVERLVSKGGVDNIISFAKSRAKSGNYDVVLKIFSKSTVPYSVKREILKIMPTNMIKNLVNIDEFNTLINDHQDVLINMLKELDIVSLGEDKIKAIFAQLDANSQGQLLTLLSQKFPTLYKKMMKIPDLVENIDVQKMAQSNIKTQAYTNTELKGLTSKENDSPEIKNTGALKPGSWEWLQSLNKQQTPVYGEKTPQVSDNSSDNQNRKDIEKYFNNLTNEGMAYLDEDSAELGFPLGSNKVGFSTPLKRKDKKRYYS